MNDTTSVAELEVLAPLADTGNAPATASTGAGGHALKHDGAAARIVEA
jgi:hypothetical protein